MNFKTTTIATLRQLFSDWEDWKHHTELKDSDPVDLYDDGWFCDVYNEEIDKFFVDAEFTAKYTNLREIDSF